MSAGRWRWQRGLVVLALLLGVVAMHSLVMPMGVDQNMSPAVVTAGAHPGGGSVPGPVVTGPRSIVGAAVEIATASPATAVEQMMHLCLAVLTALIMLGLWAITYLVVTGCTAGRGPCLPAVTAMWPRAPPPTAVRLAQLCVLRN